MFTSIKETILDAIDPLIRDGEAAEMLGCSKATFWRRVADGTITKPLKIGGTSRWPQSEIQAVILRAKAERQSLHG